MKMIKSLKLNYLIIVILKKMNNLSMLLEKLSNLKRVLFLVFYLFKSEVQSQIIIKIMLLENI